MCILEAASCVTWLSPALAPPGIEILARAYYNGPAVQDTSRTRCTRSPSKRPPPAPPRRPGPRPRLPRVQRGPPRHLCPPLRAVRLRPLPRGLRSKAAAGARCPQCAQPAAACAVGASQPDAAAAAGGGAGRGPGGRASAARPAVVELPRRVGVRIRVVCGHERDERHGEITVQDANSCFCAVLRVCVHPRRVVLEGLIGRREDARDPYSAGGCALHMSPSASLR